MMAHVTRAEFFLKAERKALGGKKLSGLELPLRKKKMQCGRWDWRAQSRESLVCPFNSLIVGGKYCCRDQRVGSESKGTC